MEHMEKWICSKEALLCKTLEEKKAVS